jgi:hypothetical protein
MQVVGKMLALQCWYTRRTTRRPDSLCFDAMNGKNSCTGSA